MDNLPDVVAFPRASTPAPKTGSTRPRRPPQLNNARWLANRYLHASDQTIAIELGVDRKTVRAARRRHGIPSQARGPRRGTNLRLAPAPQTRNELPDTLQQIAVRYQQDITHGIPPTWEQTLLRLKTADTARRNHDRQAEADAAIALAAAAARLATQLTNTP